MSDSFARVLGQLQAGRGPTSSFRAYLFTTIRNRHRDTVRTSQREQPVSDRPWILEDSQEAVEPADEAFHDGDAVAALTSLPDSWRRILWHLEVEGRRVPEVADLLSTSPAAVSALAYRAREGLKIAFLQQRLTTAPSNLECTWVHERLSRYVRGAVSSRARRRIEGHVATCAECALALEELENVNRKLAALLLPILLVGGVHLLGDPPLSSEPGQATADAGSPPAAGRHLVGAPVAAATMAAILVAAVVVVALVLRSTGGHTEVSALPEKTAAPADVGGVVPDSSTIPTPRVTPTDDPDPTPVEPTPAKPIPATTLPTATDRTPADTTDDPMPADSPTNSPTSSPTVTNSPTVTPRTPVRAARPTATPVTGCGTVGALAMPTTEGVRYALVRGDGHSGPWRVRASAQRGYVIEEGTRTRFSGDLGTPYPCPKIASAITTQAGTGWELSVDVTASGATTYPMQLRVDFATVVVINANGVSGSGWTCHTTDGSVDRPLDGGPSQYLLQPGLQWVICEADYLGADPAALHLTMVAVGAPTGTVTVMSEGAQRDTADF